MNHLTPPIALSGNRTSSTSPSSTKQNISFGLVFKSLPESVTVSTKTVLVLAKFSKVSRKLKQFSPKPFHFWPGFKKFSGK
jgi:hypothetical protein